MVEPQKGDMVSIRHLQKQDLHKVIIWNRDPEINVFMDGQYPQDIKEAENLFIKEKKYRTMQKFIMEVNGSLIGDLELVNIKWPRREAEIRVRIGEKACWSRGFGTEAIKQMLEKAFDELGLERVYLKVYDFNLRTIRCYEKCGFRKIGILRRTRPANREKAWKNIVLMLVTKGFWSKNAAGKGISSLRDRLFTKI